MEAFNTGDRILFARLLDPSDPDREMLIKGFDGMLAAGVAFQQSDVRLYIVESSEAMTRIRAHYRERISVNGVTVSDEESGSELTLIEQNGRWYFSGLGRWPPPGWILERTPVPYATPIEARPEG